MQHTITALVENRPGVLARVTGLFARRGFTVSAAVLATMMPARVEPVKDIMSMPGWAAMTWPTEGPSPLTML